MLQGKQELFSLQEGIEHAVSEKLIEVLQEMTAPLKGKIEETILTAKKQVVK